MKEYINRVAVIPTLEDYYEPIDPDRPMTLTLGQIAEVVKNMPAADVVEVRHGRWIEEHGETFIPIEYDTNGELILHNYVGYHCSLCGRYEHVQEPYCNCGALMDGKVNRHEVSES